ncbi:uncharacterized protein K444DRAFT_135851 [Hyaloscypha bicolor E]|uniref:Uncharacterized protein n=1 Tax=Hyaloscypha bicolor E TaxID=1095630 RepID=A0A2J6STU2_9HELO|nr:uncharacterized protein K444DRAFT_135851 [Hyaloscypha bicolor E]PMD54113.1 hypothetical protein K444DRAFT_135851 [Hyaloscypha bicolor E]
MSVLNINHPNSDGYTVSTSSKSQRTTVLLQETKTLISMGSNGDVLPKSRLRFWMVNNRPAVDEAGNFLHTSKVGANATIEVSEHKLSSGKLEFIKTIWSEAVQLFVNRSRSER